MSDGKPLAKSLVEKILGERSGAPTTRRLPDSAKPVATTSIFANRKFREFHFNHAQLRAWLPEKADIALRQTALASDSFVADWARAFFVAFLYGEHELARMRQAASGLYYVPPPKSDPGDMPLFSRSRQPPHAEPLGKNIFPLKVFIPRQLKTAMETQADKVGKWLSDFVRGLLIERLLGSRDLVRAFASVCSGGFAKRGGMGIGHRLTGREKFR